MNSSIETHPTLSARAALGALAATGLLILGGCATPVNLNQPVPVENITPPAPAPSAPPSTYAPVVPQAPPPSEAQPIAPGAPITVQPLGPQTAPAPSASMPATMPPPAASAPVQPPASASSRPSSALPPGGVRYLCEDGSSFVATYGDVSVTLITALGQLTLDQTVSADGARYRNSAFQVWFKGHDATVTNFLQNSNTICHQQ